MILHLTLIGSCYALSNWILPNSSDFTSMWWTDGFPSHDNSWKWNRAILTGYYCIVMNTETLKITNYGPLPSQMTYEGFTKNATDNIWNTLPPANLILSITHKGVVYTAKNALPWITGMQSFVGPRLIHSGRFEQRADIMAVQFISSQNVPLNVHARLEISAWPKHLSFVLAAKPGIAKLGSGLVNFGVVGASYKLNGSNSIIVPSSPAWDHPIFTLEFWVFIETDFLSATSGDPWILGKNSGDGTNGNYGVGISKSMSLFAYINIQGFHMIGSLTAAAPNNWTHVAITYNGSYFAFYIYGVLQGSVHIGKPRTVGNGSLVIGRRPDNCCGGTTNGFSFVGFIDEIRFYHQSLSATQLLARVKKRYTTCLSPTGVMDFNSGPNAVGVIGGGYGLDSTNYLRIKNIKEPPIFAFDFWFHLPSNSNSWLLCKNVKTSNTFIGLSIASSGFQTAFLNIGTQQFSVTTNKAIKTCDWNHVVVQYTGLVLQIYLNSVLSAEKKIGLSRVVGSGDLLFGTDCSNPGKGPIAILDEIKVYNRSLTQNEINQNFKHPQSPIINSLINYQDFGLNKSSETRPPEIWNDGVMSLSFSNNQGKQLSSSWSLAKNKTWNGPNQVSLVVDPISFSRADSIADKIIITAKLLNKTSIPVRFNSSRGSFDIDLNRIVPINNLGKPAPDSYDSMERVIVNIQNLNSVVKYIDLLFLKDTWENLFQTAGHPASGISVVLRDLSGNPIGLPVQLSKGWGGPGGTAYEYFFLHGMTHLGILANSSITFEISLVYGHWGGVAVVSHSQLSLIGWGFNQLWIEAAFGSNGENINFEPDQIQSLSAITDVRPFDVFSYNNDKSPVWTNNVGGGDFFRYFNAVGTRIFPSSVKTAFLKQGPCLSEVITAGVTGSLFKHSATVSRTNDLNRVTFKLRVDVLKSMSFSRFVLFQIGADSYSATKNRLFAYGNLSGMIKEWNTTLGTNKYNQVFELNGQSPWVSLHKVDPDPSSKGSWANRGIIIRNWNARVNNAFVKPWMGEHGYIYNFTWQSVAYSQPCSTADIILPPTIKSLNPGDFIETTLEIIVIPQFYSDYIGSNVDLKNALKLNENTWKMVHREAVQNNRIVTVTTGTLISLYPAVWLKAISNKADFILKNGLGYVAVSISNLDYYSEYQVFINGTRFNQSVFGNDYWQTTYDSDSKKYTQTFNIPVRQGGSPLHIVVSNPFTVSGKSCSKASDCLGGLVCNNGKCLIPLQVGANCTLPFSFCTPPSTCTSGLCKT